MIPRIKVQVVTPYGLFLDEETELLVLPTSEGEIGVMHGHLPMICAIYPGELRLNQPSEQGGGSSKVRCAFISAGYAEIRRKTVQVVCNAAEWAQDIDTERAQIALNRALERLADPNLPAFLMQRNRHAKRRALARLHVAERYRNAHHLSVE